MNIPSALTNDTKAPISVTQCTGKQIQRPLNVFTSRAFRRQSYWASKQTFISRIRRTESNAHRLSDKLYDKLTHRVLIQAIQHQPQMTRSQMQPSHNGVNQRGTVDRADALERAKVELSQPRRHPISAHCRSPGY
jgi:hypothetical protein